MCKLVEINGSRWESVRIVVEVGGHAWNLVGADGSTLLEVNDNCGCIWTIIEACGTDFIKS